MTEVCNCGGGHHTWLNNVNLCVLGCPPAPVYKGARGSVGVKTGGSRVGGPDLCVKADGNKKQGTQMFTQVRALSMEVKPYSCLIDLDDVSITRVDLPRDRRG